MAIKQEYVKVLNRFPPGDKWVSVSDTHDIIYQSLTDALEFVYTQHHSTKFLVDAEAGSVYIIKDIQVEDPKPEPAKSYSLYGDR